MILPDYEDWYIAYPPTTDYRNIPPIPIIICPVCGEILEIASKLSHFAIGGMLFIAKCKINGV